MNNQNEATTTKRNTNKNSQEPDKKNKKELTWEGKPWGRVKAKWRWEVGGGRGKAGGDSGGEDGERAARREAAAGDEVTGKRGDELGQSTHGHGHGASPTSVYNLLLLINQPNSRASSLKLINNIYKECKKLILKLL